MTLVILTTVVIVIATATIAKLSDSYEEKIKRIVWPNSSYQLQTTSDWCDAGNNLMNWCQSHPLGATNETERIELSNLIHDEIGSYILFRLAHDQPAFDDHVRLCLEKIESWRE